MNVLSAFENYGGGLILSELLKHTSSDQDVIHKLFYYPLRKVNQ